MQAVIIEWACVCDGVCVCVCTEREPNLHTYAISPESRSVHKHYLGPAVSSLESIAITLQSTFI